MQHFSVYTNWLDFTEDALSSIYFALEAYIDEDSGKCKKNSDASIYVFSPYLYNRLLYRNLKNIGKKKLATDKLLSKVFAAYKSLSKRTSLPNLSLPENEETFSMYLFGQNDICSRLRLPEMYYPIAIHTSRLNPRVKSQHGAFMAFNAFMPNIQGASESSYSRFCIEEIQKIYLENDPNAKPFLYKLIIPNDQKRPIADILTTIGMSKERIYPELQNAGDRIKQFF